MKLIQRYIFKEIFPLFIFGNIFFIFLILLERLINLTNLLFSNNVSNMLLITTILYFIPSIIVVTIPLASLLATIIAFGRLSSDSELVAIRSIGVSNFSIVKPVVAFALIAFISGVAVSVLLIEKSSIATINNLNKIAESISIDDIQEKEMYMKIPGILLFVNEKNSDSSFSEVIAVNKSDNLIISSEQANISPTIDKSIEMIFIKGKLTLPSKNEESATIISFDNLTMNLPLNIDIAKTVTSTMTMGVDELYSNRDTPANAYELTKRFMLPLASIILSLFGVTLGMFSTRSGKSYGLIVATVVALVYYFMIIYFENIAIRGTLNPYLAASIPNIIFTVLLIGFFIKRAK